MEIFLIPFLLIAGFTDIKEQKIPNPLVILAAVTGLGLWYFFRPPLLETVLGLLIMCLITCILFIWKKALGAGDIKLLFLIGFYQRIPFCAFTFLFASLSSLAFLFITRKKREKNGKIPFAPFLCGGYLIAVLLQWILSIF